MNRVKVTKDNVAKVVKSIKGLTLNQVLVGIPSQTAERTPDADDPSPLNNAEIGYLMENGSPVNNLPERPFLKPGVGSVTDKVADRYRKGAVAVMDGKISSIDQVHDAVGFIAESAVKAKITDGPFAPLSERTLAARRARGRTSEKPLLDTGQLRRSITHVIRPKG